MVAACLESLSSKRRDGAKQPIRILDPACGDGAFLVEAFLQLSTAISQPASLVQLIRDHLFGVDLDEEAILKLRARFRQLVEGDSTSIELNEILERNFRVGDSLAGGGFDRVASSAGKADFAWTEAFPEVAVEGGFDLVIGNPPYLRERNAKELFARIAETPLGRRWRRGRMDLWHYFVHRGLDLLREGGTLAYVVNSYWTSSHGAIPLIERLRTECALQEFHLLGNEPVFDGVSGRHMTFRLLRRPAQPCDRVRITTSDSAVVATVAHHDLFEGDRVVFPFTTTGQSSGKLTGTPLTESFDVRQGIAENPPRISAAIVRNHPGRYVAGAGVFVLTDAELARLDFSADERKLLRPYFETSAIGRYTLREQPTHSLLYLTRKTAPNLESYPKIAAHLEPFRPLLELRREVQTGRIAWWHLHWPRDEAVFSEPRILSVQMGKCPQFVYVERPTHVGFSVNVIRAGSGNGMSLEALTGILNSQIAAHWFQRYAKHRGANLDISGGVLRRFPLPPPAELEKNLQELVRARQSASAAEAAAVEFEIEQLVTEWYRPEGVTSSV